MPLVDTLADIRSVLDRRRTRQLCQSAASAAAHPAFRLPEAISADDPDGLGAAVTQHQQHEVDAWIVKPALACGLDHAHEMSLVLGSHRVPAAVRGLLAEQPYESLLYTARTVCFA